MQVGRGFSGDAHEKYGGWNRDRSVSAIRSSLFLRPRQTDILLSDAFRVNAQHPGFQLDMCSALIGRPPQRLSTYCQNLLDFSGNPRRSIVLFNFANITTLSIPIEGNHLVLSFQNKIGRRI